MPPEGPRPNVLMITCHDLGRFLGCYGVATVRTPNVDRLAGEGVRFTNAFCTAPQCSPSRASIFTGRYPHANGVMGLSHGHFAWDLHPGERHLGELLREAGYLTAALGVVHESRTPRVTNGFEPTAPRLGSDKPADGDITTTAGRYLREAADAGKPFYLQVGYFEPHRARAIRRDEPQYQGFIGDTIEPDDTPGVTVPPYLVDDAGTRAEIAELQGAVARLDDHVGRLLGELDASGARDDTIVLFTTDHGIAMPRAKCSLSDAGLEVALIARWPAAASRGWTGVRHGLVSNVDLFPTLLEVCGVSVPPSDDRPIHGRSLVPMIDADAPGRDAVFGEMTYHDYYDPRRCVRTDRHKLVVNFTNAPAFMDPSQSWRPRSTPVRSSPNVGTHPPVEVYDLAEDPAELTNVAEDAFHAAARADLLKRLAAWMRQTGDPLLSGAVTSPFQTRASRMLASVSIDS